MLDLDAAIAPQRDTLLAHPIYSALHTEADVRVFMEHHVWAVWDFMALLSSLLHLLARSPLPWRPPSSDVEVQRFLHELILAEATDVDPRGGHVSHYQLYLDAMAQVGADTGPITRCVDSLRGQPLIDIPRLAAAAGAPPPSAEFVTYTLGLLAGGNAIDIAAAFAYGREEVIPGMFAAVALPADGQIDLLRYYLDRHVEVDRDDHGPLARRLVDRLCATNADRQRALTTARNALRARRRLWDGTLAAVVASRSKV